MSPEDFFTLGYIMSTQNFAARGGPAQINRANEEFEFGPYTATFGIVGTAIAPYPINTLKFEVNFGSHTISALRYAERDIANQFTGYRHEWGNAPTDADLVVLKLVE